MTDVGVRLPAHLTASGRAILAALPRSQTRALFPNAAAFVSRHETLHPITKYPQLQSHLDQVRRRGYATEDGEVTLEFASVAVAVRDHLGWPAASIAVTFLSSRVPEGEWPALVEKVRPVVEELSRRILGKGR